MKDSFLHSLVVVPSSELPYVPALLPKLPVNFKTKKCIIQSLIKYKMPKDTYNVLQQLCWVTARQTETIGRANHKDKGQKITGETRHVCVKRKILDGSNEKNLLNL